MYPKEIKKGIERAIKSFQKNDKHLLAVDTSERSMTHILAMRIAEEETFSGWDVDCEYNRNYDDIKRLNLPVEESRSDELSAKTVFPDVIIHKRGTGTNLLVLEAKKHHGEIEKDREKLKKYIEELHYLYGLLLSFPAATTGLFIFEWWSKGPSGKAELIMD